MRPQWALLACATAAWSICAHGQPAGAPTCHYGVLPGSWTFTSGTDSGQEPGGWFPVWQPFSPSCQLRPLLIDYFKGLDPANRGQDEDVRSLGILLFGDSVDFRVPKYLCNLALGQEPEVFNRNNSPDPYHFAGFCRLPKLTVAKQHISSVSLSGPYWNNVDFKPLPSIAEGLKMFQERAGAMPDVIMISSNFWDISSQYFNGGRAFRGTVLENEFLPADWVRAWNANFTTILTRLKESVPEGTLLVYHTLHVPHQTNDMSMWETDAYLRQHVAQLNAAGREVAMRLHYHILDMEMMAAQMTADTLLADITHPGPDFIIQVLNILLNMEDAHHAALQSGVQPPLRNRVGGWLKWHRQMLFPGRRRLLGIGAANGQRGRAAER